MIAVRLSAARSGSSGGEAVSRAEHSRANAVSSPAGGLRERHFEAVLRDPAGRARRHRRPAGRHPAPLDNLKASIERIIGGTSAEWGVYVKSLETGEEIAVNADRPMETASTIKLTLLTELFEQIKAGKLALTDKYTVTKADQVGGTGIIQDLDVGDALTIKDLATLMVIVSDNTATDVLFRAVGGPEVVARRMDQMGFTRQTAVDRSCVLRRTDRREGSAAVQQRPA